MTCLIRPCHEGAEMPQSVEVTAFKQKTLEPQTKNLEKVWGDAIKKAKQELQTWTKTVEKEIDDTREQVEAAQAAIEEDAEAIEQLQSSLLTGLQEIEALEQEREALERRTGVSAEDMMADLAGAADAIFTRERDAERLEERLSARERQMAKRRSGKKGLDLKLKQLEDRLAKQRDELSYTLSALSLDGLRDAIGTRFWSNQVFKDFQRAYQLIAKEAGDHASLINGLKRQPLGYKKALQKGISFYIDHLAVLYEAGREAFDASEELASAESAEEEELRKSRKIVPPIIIFDFPKPQALLKELGLKQEQIDRLPLKGSFSCILSDKEARQTVAAKGLSSTDLAQISRAAALDALKEHLKVEALKLLKLLDEDKITDVAATKRWRELVGGASDTPRGRRGAVGDGGEHPRAGGGDRRRGEVGGRADQRHQELHQRHRVHHREGAGPARRHAEEAQREQGEAEVGHHRPAQGQGGRRRDHRRLHQQHLRL